MTTMPDRMSVKVCPQCVARNDASYSRCWLCSADLSRAETTSVSQTALRPNPYAAPVASGRPDQPAYGGTADWVYQIVNSVIFSGLALMGFGLAWRNASPTAIVSVAFGGAVFGAGFALAMRRQQRLAPHRGPSEKVFWALLRTITIVAALCVGVPVALFLLLLAYCLVAVSTGSSMH